MKGPFVIPSELEQALQPYEPTAATLYSIDEAAHLVQLPRHHIAVYYRHGLLPAAEVIDAYGALHFTAAAIRALRRIEAVRRLCDSELNALKLALRLMDEIDRLKDETRDAREAPGK